MTPALPLAAALALSAVSSSDVGVVVTGANGTAELLAACPRAVESALPTATTAGFLRVYQQQCAGGTGILELPALSFAPSLRTEAAGIADAGTYFGFIGGSAIPFGVLATDVQWIAGPANLFDVVDPNASQANADWLRGFAGELARRIAADAAARQADFHLLLPRWSSPTAGAFCDVFRAARAGDPVNAVAWTWRAAVTDLTPPASGALGAILGYAQVKSDCGLLGVPLFADVARAGGWFQGGTTSSGLVEWIRAIDSAADGDAEVRAGAVLLRSIGGGGVDDLSPAVPEIAAFLANPSAPPGNGGGSSGGTPLPQTPGGGTGTLSPGGGHKGGCGTPGGALALLGLAPLLLRRLSRRR